MGWVERIGELYRLNDQRLEVRDDAAAFATADGALRAAVTAFGARGEAELACRTCTRRRGRSWRAWATTGPADGFVEHRGADGQQHGGAIGTRAGGGSEARLR